VRRALIVLMALVVAGAVGFGVTRLTSSPSPAPPPESPDQGIAYPYGELRGGVPAYIARARMLGGGLVVEVVTEACNTDPTVSSLQTESTVILLVHTSRLSGDCPVVDEPRVFNVRVDVKPRGRTVVDELGMPVPVFNCEFPHTVKGVCQPARL